MAVNLMFCLLLMIFLCSLTNANNSLNQNNLEFSTEECQLVEPVYNNTFNFGHLRSELAHVVKSVQGDVFEFNVCGGILSKECAGMQNMAACLTKQNGQQYILGVKQELRYKNGKMYFSFSNGDRCNNEKNYTLDVLVSCDYTIDKLPLTVNPYVDDECSFYVLWETPYACLPEPESTKFNTCSIEDKQNGHVFDLMPLSDSNHRISDRNDSYFILNVCKPVLYGQNSMCPPGSSICYINKNAKNIQEKFLNYGFVESKPTIENGRILMRHSSAVPCNSTHNITSTIYFDCDTSTQLGQPDFIGRKNCNYEFSWQTSLVCSNIIPCFASDIRSGIEYDFSSLSHKTFKIQHNDGNLYTLGICSNAESPCFDNAGSCKTENLQTTTLGKANNHLRFNITGTPFLLYENGAHCNESAQKQWTTKIDFTCALNDANDNQPKIIENSNCLLLIHFPTKLACQKQISCKTQKGSSGGGSSDDEQNKIDLTPLISTKDNYIARINESLSDKIKKSTRFYLNVCRPLVSQLGLGCSGGSAICEAVMGPKNPEEEKNLGYPDVSLIRISSSRAELNYINGDVCHANSSKRFSTTIQFLCDPNVGKGTPILQSIVDQCHYRFDWPTNVICPPHLCKFNADNCEIINEEQQSPSSPGQKLNLRTANFTDNGKIMINASPKPFYVDLCGPNRKAISDYSQGIVKLFFTTNGPCGFDGSINVVLRLSCNDSEHRSSSSDDQQCSLVINQNTPEVCPLLGWRLPKHVSTSTSTSTITTPSEATTTTTKETPVTGKTTVVPGVTEESKKITHIAVLIGGLLIVITLGTTCLVILRNPDRRRRLKNIFRKASPVVHYSRVANAEEANLLLNLNADGSESDDEMLL